ncbi:MAG: hypothetical protein VCE75_19955, partial [Alphaproteobacteria bacterium]
MDFGWMSLFHFGLRRRCPVHAAPPLVGSRHHVEGGLGPLSPPAQGTAHLYFLDIKNSTAIGERLGDE